MTPLYAHECLDLCRSVGDIGPSLNGYLNLGAMVFAFSGATVLLALTYRLVRSA